MCNKVSGTAVCWPIAIFVLSGATGVDPALIRREHGWENETKNKELGAQAETGIRRTRRQQIDRSWDTRLVECEADEPEEKRKKP